MGTAWLWLNTPSSVPHIRATRTGGGKEGNWCRRIQERRVDEVLLDCAADLRTGFPDRSTLPHPKRQQLLPHFWGPQTRLEHPELSVLPPGGRSADLQAPSDLSRPEESLATGPGQRACPINPVPGTQRRGMAAPNLTPKPKSGFSVCCGSCFSPQQDSAGDPILEGQVGRCHPGAGSAMILVALPDWHIPHLRAHALG